MSSLSRGGKGGRCEGGGCEGGGCEGGRSTSSKLADDRCSSFERKFLTRIQQSSIRAVYYCRNTKHHVIDKKKKFTKQVILKHTCIAMGEERSGADTERGCTSSLLGPTISTGCDNLRSYSRLRQLL